MREILRSSAMNSLSGAALRALQWAAPGFVKKAVMFLHRKGNQAVRRGRFQGRSLWGPRIPPLTISDYDLETDWIIRIEPEF